MARISDEELKGMLDTFNSYRSDEVYKMMINQSLVKDIALDLQDERQKQKDKTVKGDDMEEFDISKVKTCLNADDVKAGDTGIFADNLMALKENFKDRVVWSLTKIEDEVYNHRFITGRSCYALFYPLEQKKPSLRGYLQELANKHQLSFCRSKSQIDFFMFEKYHNAEEFFNFEISNFQDDFGLYNFIYPDR